MTETSLIHIPTLEAHPGTNDRPSLSLRQYWEANQDKVQNFDLVIRAYLVGVGEGYVTHGPSELDTYHTATREGYSILYYDSYARAIEEFIPRKQFEDTMIDISDSPYAAPRKDIPDGIRVRYSEYSEEYIVQMPGEPGGTSMSVAYYTSRFNDPAADARPAPYLTVAQKDGPFITGIVPQEDTPFFRVFGETARHRVEPAGSFIEPSPGSPEGFELRNPKYARLGLRVAKPR